MLTGEELVDLQQNSHQIREEGMESAPTTQKPHEILLAGGACRVQKTDRWFVNRNIGIEGSEKEGGQVHFQYPEDAHANGGQRLGMFSEIAVAVDQSTASQEVNSDVFRILH